MSSYTDAALQYAEDVVKGRVPACNWVRLACIRQRKDLKRAGKKTWPFYFDQDQAGLVCETIELFPHVKGEWATRGETIKLEPWQLFIITTVFGWRSKETGLRRFRTAYIEVPRKNAKSTLTAAVALYMLALDGEYGAELYSAATTRGQARIIWEVAQVMVKKSPEFRATFKIAAKAHAVTRLETNSLFQPLSSDANSLEGLNTHYAAIDELHAHKTRKVYEVMESSTGSRSQPLLWNITTAGVDLAGICYEQHNYVTKILQSIFEDETYFGIIYTIDEGDDWSDEKIWKKANPNYGVSVKPDDVKRLHAKASKVPSSQANFLTKRLDVWVGAGAPWMDMIAWAGCADFELEIEEFKGEPCFAALDLASKVDIAALVLLFEREGEYYAFGKWYLPAETIKKSGNAQYDGWRRKGKLITTEGNIIDLERIEDDLKALSSDHEVLEVPYDPFQATQFSTRMIKEGFPMVEMRPTVLNFSEPMKELEALVIDGRFHHDGDPVFTWMASNVVAHLDNKDNIYPRKELFENKIDGIVATIMALGRAIVFDKEAGVSIYEDEETRPGLISF